jgi:hypothetical protein
MEPQLSLNSNSSYLSLQSWGHRHGPPVYRGDLKSGFTFVSGRWLGGRPPEDCSG